MSSKKKLEEDERFLRVQKDPRFWEMPEKEHKIKIDKRFKSMFHDERFKVKYTVDKRGRPFSHCSTDDLKRFYNVSDEEEEEEGSKAAEEKDKKKKSVKPEREVRRGATEVKPKREQPEPKVQVDKEGEKSFYLLFHFFQTFKKNGPITSISGKLITGKLISLKKTADQTEDCV